MVVIEDTFEAKFRSLLRRVALLERRSGGGGGASTWLRWAVVTDTDPLTVSYEDGKDPPTATAQTVAAVAVGDRVRVAVYRGQATILGQAGGPPPAPVLPAAQTVLGATINEITALAWADFPTPLEATLILPASAIVQISLSAWISMSSEPNGRDLRASTRGTGPTPFAENDPDWGVVIYQNSAAGEGEGANVASVKTLELATGTTTISARAYINRNDNTSRLNYPVLQVTPLRWA